MVIFLTLTLTGTPQNRTYQGIALMNAFRFKEEIVVFYLCFVFGEFHLRYTPIQGHVRCFNQV